MQTTLLTLLSLGLFSLGVSATVLLATSLPAPALLRAQSHGRFAGFGSASHDDEASEDSHKAAGQFVLTHA
ncbi:hypothetical protein J5T34_22630 [Cupriavidus gilardii]|uniref:hypothetical protein n=1 Tax=Cupriavidus gilardii TaxID=82541 RepID=UPI001ABE29F9|nr:hypothetical protein [Cupriavidus gilardii]MBO4123530.1 hypothetical protein [Cupriavidus gilardii]